MAWGFKEYAAQYGIEYTPLHERDKKTADILKGIGTTPAIISAVPPQPMGDFRQLDQDSIAKPFVPVAPQDLSPAKATAVNWDTYKDGGTVATRKQAPSLLRGIGASKNQQYGGRGADIGVTKTASVPKMGEAGYVPSQDPQVQTAMEYVTGLAGGTLAKALGKTVGKSLMTKAGKVWDAAKGAWVKVPDAAKPVIKTGATIGAGATGYETVRGAFDPDYAGRRETFPSQFGASVRGGVGDTVSLAGSALEWKGYEEAAKKLKELGTGISEGYESEYVPFTWQAVFNPNWWANNVARTIPTTAALIPAMLIAYKVGAKGAALRGFGKFGQVVIGSLAGSTLSRPLESALESGAVFEETGDAKKAQEVYDANMKLAALDSAQLALAFAPAPVKGVSKFGKAAIAASKTKPGKFVRATTKLAGVGVTEGLEEGYQEAVSTRATGEDNRSIIQQILRPTPELAEAMAIGGIFGIGIGGAGVINDVYTEAKSVDNAIRSQVAETLSNQAKLQILQTIDNYMAEGMNEEEATIHVLELLAETEEGREVIIAATQTVASEYVNNSGDIQQLVLERLAESNPAVLAKAGDKVYDSFTGTELTVTDDSAPDRFTVVNAYGQQGTIMRSDVSFDKPETPKMQAMEQGQAEEGMPIMPSASITDQGTRVYDKNTGEAFTVVLQTSPEFVVVEDSEGGNTIMSVDDLTTGTIEAEDFQKGETVLDGEGNLVVVVNSGNEKTMLVKGSDGKARVINKADASRTVESSESTHQSGENVPASEEEIQTYADNVIKTGEVKSVTLIGSTVTKGKGNDVDILYDLGEMELPEDSGEAAAEIEAFIENMSAPIDLDTYDAFFKVGERYFHLQAGAGREIVENTDYAKEQAGKPSKVLAQREAREEQVEPVAQEQEPEQVEGKTAPAGESAIDAITETVESEEIIDNAEDEFQKDVEEFKQTGNIRELYKKYGASVGVEIRKRISSGEILALKDIQAVAEENSKRRAEQRKQELEYAQSEEGKAESERQNQENWRRRNEEKKQAFTDFGGDNIQPGIYKDVEIDSDIELVYKVIKSENGDMLILHGEPSDLSPYGGVRNGVPDDNAVGFASYLSRGIVKLLSVTQAPQNESEEIAPVVQVSNNEVATSETASSELQNKIDREVKSQAFEKAMNVMGFENLDDLSKNGTLPPKNTKKKNFLRYDIYQNQKLQFEDFVKLFEEQLSKDEKTIESITEKFNADKKQLDRTIQVEESFSKNDWEVPQDIILERGSRYVNGEDVLVKHKESVAKALNEGKPVPEEVLKGYPDLVNKTGSKSTGESAPVVSGKTATVKTERGTQIEVQYAVVNADDLIASHSTDLKLNPEYPQELQPRDRGRIASEMQVTKIANNLEPEFLGENPKASEGAPIVGNDMVVESGNGRIIAIKRVYDKSHANAEKYKRWLMDKADKFGLDATGIEGMDKPVLVRVRTSEVNRADFVKEANEQSVAAMSATEQALSDAGKLTESLLGRFYPSEDGTINNKENRNFIRDFMAEVIGPTEQGRYVTADGSISQEGVNRIRNAIFAKAYGDVTAIEKLAESTDNNIKAITNALLMLAPRFAKLKASIEAGKFYPLDITPELANAARKLSQLREERMSVESYLSQTSMFGEEMDQLSKDILKILDFNKRSAKKIFETFDTYINAVIQLGDPNQITMFDDGSPVPTKADLIDAALQEIRAHERSKKNEPVTLFQNKPKGSSAVEETGKGQQASGESEGKLPGDSQQKQEEVKVDRSKKKKSSVNFKLDNESYPTTKKTKATGMYWSEFDHKGKPDLAVVGSDKILKDGLTDFDSWSASMLKDFGVEVENRLDVLWKKANGLANFITKKEAETQKRINRTGKDYAKTEQAPSGITYESASKAERQKWYDKWKTVSSEAGDDNLQTGRSQNREGRGISDTTGDYSTNSPEFKAWFGDSKVVDENGEPLVVYHGTGAKINEFKPEFTGQGNDQLGSGFYFSTNKEDAEIYQTKQLPTGESKLGGLDNPNIVSAYLSIQKPITIKGDTLVDSDVSLSQNQAYKILKYSPSIMDKEESPLGDWFEAYYEVGPKEYMVKNVATHYTGKSLLSLENDFFKGESTAFRNALNKVLGYDGVVKEFSNGQKHYVAWFPTQIKSIYNQGTWDATNPDIRFKSDSVNALAKDLNLTPAPEAMEQEIFQAANTLSQIFTGNDIVTFKGKGIQGMADGDTVYINAEAKDPVLYVAKHEIVHTLETTDPESYKKLMQLVRRYFNGNQEMVKHYQKQKYTAEEAWGEFTSDVVSEVMEEPGFWKLVRERSPKLIKAVVDIIDQIITKFKKAIAKEDSMLQYINDLESFKAEVAGVVAESLSKPKRRNILDLRTDTQVAAKNKAEKAPSMINLPKRYTPYGVGKDIGGKVYLHKQYENVLPQNLLADAKDKLPKGFEYTGVSYDRKSGQFTFTYSPDFDTAHEPTVGNQIVVKPDGNLLIIKQKDNPQIWHHKWLWVKDDYKGFNVEESKERSRMWSAIPNVDKSRIGYKDFWETNVVPLIEPSSKLHQAISSAGTSLHQIAATFKSRWFTPGKLNIDIGGGKFDKGSEFLKETYGTENLIYDPYNRTPGYNKMIMDRFIAGERGDTVTVNNVLNVIAESDVRANVILQAAKAVKDNSNVFFAIYEGSGTGIGSTTPRGWQNNSRAEYYVDEVKKYFGTVERKGSLIIASNPKNISQSAIWELGNDTRIKFKRNLLDGIGTTKNVNETEAKYKFGRPQIEPQEFIGPLKGVVIEANRVHRAEVAATGLRTERWKETLSEEQLQDLGAFIEKVENLKSEKDFATIAKEINADPEMKKVLQEYMVTQESMRRKINDYLRDVTDEDYIKFVENYIPHFYINEPGTSKKVSTDKVGKWIRNSPNAKQRKIPTLKEARDLGLVPLTQNIAELQNKWANINWLVATNRKLLSSVKEFTNADGENIIMKANNAPTDWIRVKHPAFARIYARKTESGQTVLYEGEVAVDPEAYKILRQVIEEPLSGGVINAIESFNAYAKKAQLSFSLFHHWALTESAIGALGVKGLILVGKDTQGLGKGIITQPHRVGKKLMEQEDFLRDAIMHGLTLESVSDAHVGKVKSGLVSLERKTEGKLFVGKTAEKARQFNDAWDKTLWTNYHNGLKAYTYYALTEKYISQLPSNATAADISGVKEKIAETINDMYGGQEWASKFWLSPQARQMWQMLQLAPDWTLSNANVAAKAITKAKDPVMGPILRKYWSNMLLSQALIISAMCFAFSGHFPWDNEEGHKTEIEVTAITRRLNKLFGKHEKNPDQRYYMHPGKQIREVVGWVTDPLLTVRRKASPAVHTVIEQISGHSTTGWEMPWTENGVEKNFWSSLPQRTVAAAEKFVPFSIGGLASQTQFAFTFPMRKGMTPWKAVRAYEDVIRMNVDPTFAQKAYKIPAAKAKKAITGQSLLGRLDEACVTNGLDPDKMYRDARSKVVSQYYGEMWGAINHDNMRKADKAAQVLLELDVTASGLKSSAKARGLSEEDYIKAIEVMRRNAGKR